MRSCGIPKAGLEYKVLISDRDHVKELNNGNS